MAAALEAGYHKEADTGKYEITPQFQSDAQSSYQKVKQKLQGNDITHQYGDLYGAPSNDISDPGYLATHTQLDQDILNYAQNHPLDKKTAYPQNVSVTDKAGKTVNDSNP